MAPDTAFSPDYYRELLGLAERAAATAYSPYSRFRVGAIAVSATGARYAGCNVENASYGLTSCAERNAVFAGVQAEGPAFRLVAMACVEAGGAYFPPCGACRQVIAEFSDEETVVGFPGPDGPVVRRIGELLPSAFERD